MKLRFLLLSLFLISPTGCNSLGLNSEARTRELKTDAAQASEQVDNVNYVIYSTYQRYQLAKKQSNSSKKVSSIETELGKLNQIKSYLEHQQSKASRKLKSN